VLLNASDESESESEEDVDETDERMNASSFHDDEPFFPRGVPGDVHGVLGGVQQNEAYLIVIILRYNIDDRSSRDDIFVFD